MKAKYNCFRGGLKTNINQSKAMNTRGTASHYLGSTKKPVGDRFNEHQSQVGARITKAAVEQGRKLVLVRTWRGGRSRERKLKKLHNNRLLCPICNPRCDRKHRKSKTHKSCGATLGKD
jgi:predicted GIY-YIG superfamily endonuclease